MSDYKLKRLLLSKPTDIQSFVKIMAIIVSLVTECHYTLDIKFMVQTRQLKKSHVDSHYAAAIFQYQQEIAVQL